MSARKELFAGRGAFGRDFINPLARYTQEPFTPGIITREQLVKNVAQLGASLTSRIDAFQEKARELKVRNAPVLAILPSMGIVDNARQRFLGHSRELPHLLKNIGNLRRQLGSARANELIGALIGSDALYRNRDWLGQLTLRLNQGATAGTAPLFFPALGNDSFNREPKRRRAGKRTLPARPPSGEKQKDNTPLYIISGVVIGGGILIAGAIGAFASVPDDGGDGPIVPPTRTPTPTDTGGHDQLKATAHTTPTAVALAVETTVASANKPMVILCPPENGKSPVVVPDNLSGKINPDDIQIKAVSPDQQDHLAKLYAAIDAKNFGPDAVVMCTPNNSIGEAGVSYVVQVFSFTELSTGQVTHSEHLFVHFGDNRGLVGVTENRLLAPGGNTWLAEQGYATDHFVMGKPGDNNHLDGVLYYKLDTSNGNEYVAGILTQDGLVTGKAMVEKFGKVLANTPHAVATRASDINNGHQVAYFGYAEAQFEGKTVLQLTAYDKDGQIIWPATLEQGGEAAQSTITNEKVFDLLKAKGAGELTFDGLKWHTTINGKDVIYTGASIEDPTFAYLYATDGSRIWVMNDKGTDFTEISAVTTSLYKGTDGKIHEETSNSVLLAANKKFTGVTRDEKGQLTNGLFTYHPLFDSWFATDIYDNLPTAQEWQSNRAGILNNWVETVKLTGFKNSEQIRNFYRQYVKLIAPDTSQPDFVFIDPKHGHIPIDVTFFKDPSLFLLLVKEIKYDSSAAGGKVLYGEAKSGIMRLNPEGFLGQWPSELLGPATTITTAKEGAVIAWQLKQASDVCALGGVNVKIAEANTQLFNWKVAKSFWNRVKNSPTFDYTYYFNEYLKVFESGYKDPTKFPRCG